MLVVELIQVKCHVSYLFEVVVYGKAMDYLYDFFLLLSLLEMELDEQCQIISL